MSTRAQPRRLIRPLPVVWGSPRMVQEHCNSMEPTHTLAEQPLAQEHCRLLQTETWAPLQPVSRRETLRLTAARYGSAGILKSPATAASHSAPVVARSTHKDSAIR